MGGEMGIEGWKGSEACVSAPGPCLIPAVWAFGRGNCDLIRKPGLE